MAKKSKKVEKETRRLMESIADLVKKKGDRYKFRTKSKKAVKKVKKSCVHWIMRKGKEAPTVVHDPNKPGNWRCTICGASFPIKPLTRNEYEDQTDNMMELINQMLFWSVKLGGNADDTKMFIRLKSDLPRYKKVARQILKRVNQREEWENNRSRSDIMSQFDAYGINYRN